MTKDRPTQNWLEEQGEISLDTGWRRPAMLKSYEQQLMAARQLARFRVRKRLEANEDPRDPDLSISRNQKMRQVATELYTNLLFTGSADSFLEDMRVDLGNALGLELEFAYPPGKPLCLMAREGGALRHLTSEEWNRLGDLKTATSLAVDQKMQRNPVQGENSGG